MLKDAVFGGQPTKEETPLSPLSTAQNRVATANTGIDFWLEVIRHPDWDSQAEKAESLLIQCHEDLLYCADCEKLSRESQPSHESVFCQGVFRSGGIGYLLFASVNQSHLQSIGLIKQLTTQHKSSLTPEAFLKAAMLAVDKGDCATLLLFNWHWFCVISEVFSVAHSDQKMYARYVSMVIKNMCDRVNQSLNITNAREVLVELLPSMRRNYRQWEALMDSLDDIDLLSIVGTTPQSQSLRQILVEDYQVLWKPGIAIPPNVMQIIACEAQYILWIKLGKYTNRDINWFRRLIRNVSLLQYITQAAESLVIDIMARPIGINRKILYRFSLSSALPSISSIKLSYAKASYMRIKSTLRLKLCPCIASNQGINKTGGDTELLLGQTMPAFTF